MKTKDRQLQNEKIKKLKKERIFEYRRNEKRKKKKYRKCTQNDL